MATPDADHDVLAQLMAGEMALAANDLTLASQHYDKAMALSDDPKVAERAAGLAIAIHDGDAAQRALDRWQLLGAPPAAMAQARAQRALDGGDAADAERQLRRLLHVGGKDAWRLFGRVLIGARDQAQAGRLLEALATPQSLPADERAWLAMSELGDQLGQHRYAVETADAAVKRFGSAETYAWAAQMKLKDGDQAEARRLLHKAMVKAPENITLRLAYAGMVSQAGDFGAATEALAHGPQNADTFAMRAGLAAQQKDEKALRALYLQMQAAPADVRQSSAFLLGQLAEMQRLPTEALGWYDEVSDTDEHAFEADLRSALILHSQGERAQAHELLEQLQMAYLDQPEPLRQAWQADAELYLTEQNYPRAEAAFSRALQVVPDDPGLLYGRGMAYAQAGQIDEAVADFRQILEIKPDDVDASNALGYTLADANRDLPEAEQLLQVARKAKPDDPAIADSWGWLQYRLGHVEAAAQTLRGAWSARKDADVGVHLGEVLWKLGHAREADQVFDEVRALDPKNEVLLETLQRLRP